MLVMFLALACAPKPEPPEMGVAPERSPVLPALQAPVYTTGHTLPKDELVAQVALGLRWDEGLSGAAAAIALDRDSTASLERAQYAAYRAGYPYPVRALSVGQVTPGAYPEGLAATLRDLVRQKDDLGLARVRVQDKDRWVALVASPLGVLQAMNREYPIDGDVEIRTSAPATWSLVSPTGNMVSGPTPGQHQLNEEGEWWLDVHGSSGRLVGVPLYAGMTTPQGSVLDLPGEDAEGPSDAVFLALEGVDEIRTAFSLPAINVDGTLTTLAEYPLSLVLAGTWDPASGRARLQAAGFVGGPVGQVSCTGPTVSACLDQLLRSGRGREVLLDPRFRLGGAAAQVATDGVTLVLNLASE